VTPSRRKLGERTLNQTLEDAAAQRPSHIALRDAISQLTYSELFDAASRVAGGYHALGVRRQEPVMLMLDNHLDSVLAWVGLSFNASMETLVNTAYKGASLSHLIRDSGARYAVVEEHYLAQVLEVNEGQLEVIVTRPSAGTSTPQAPAVAHSHDTKIVPYSELLAHPSRGPESVDPWDLLAILYTSGTTGISKGALLPHAAAYTTAEFTGRQGPDDIRYVVAPQFHVAGQWGGVYRALIPASTAYIASGFHASTFWEEVQEVGATTTQLVGTMPEFLLRQPRQTNDHDNPMREIYMTPVTSDLAGFRMRFGVDVVTGFGSTEGGTFLVDDEPDQVAPRRCGREHPDVVIRLVDEHDIEVAPGEAGEAVVRPKLPWIVMAGWHGRPDQTAEAWRNGWLHSGDALRQDSDGVYHFVDRVDDAIRRRGENVSSYEVEVEVVGHPDVLEAAAVAVDSEFSEDEIKIIVIRRDESDLTEESLVRYLADRMPYFAVPRYVEFVDDLPRTPTQKVKKAELRGRGVGAAWDREKAGIIVTRAGLRIETQGPS
jgi:crotonobetaine/carnitine-CoA ligase